MPPGLRWRSQFHLLRCHFRNEWYEWPPVRISRRTRDLRGHDGGFALVRIEKLAFACGFLSLFFTRFFTYGVCLLQLTVRRYESAVRSVARETRRQRWFLNSNFSRIRSCILLYSFEIAKPKAEKNFAYWRLLSICRISRLAKRP